VAIFLKAGEIVSGSVEQLMPRSLR
jgi:hypothetical protein